MKHIPDKQAVRLAHFARTHRDIAELIVGIFKADREKARDAIEISTSVEDIYKAQGKAQAFKEASEIFDNAILIAESVEKRKGGT